MNLKISLLRKPFNLRLTILPDLVHEFDLVGSDVKTRSIPQPGRSLHDAALGSFDTEVGGRWIVPVQNSFEIFDLPNHFWSEPGGQRILSKIEIFPGGIQPIL